MTFSNRLVLISVGESVQSHFLTLLGLTCSL